MHLVCWGASVNIGVDSLQRLLILILSVDAGLVGSLSSGWAAPRGNSPMLGNKPMMAPS